MELIVVGVDGSAQSKRALEWAADEAHRRSAVLKVVMSWEDPSRDMWIPHVQPRDDGLKLTRDTLERMVTQTLGEHPKIKVEILASEGPAAKVLLDAAKDAELLVVGNRGRGGFGGVVLGSVSLHCASHAPCPVVVVRGKAGDEPAPSPTKKAAKAKTTGST